MNETVLIHGARLARGLLDVRVARLSGNIDGASEELQRWQQRRQAFEQKLSESPDSALSVLAQRLELSPSEIDLLLVCLAPHVDPDFLDLAMSRSRRMLFRGIDVELLLGLVFHSDVARLRGRAALAPGGRLVRNGLLQLAPIGTELQPR